MSTDDLAYLGSEDRKSLLNAFQFSITSTMREAGESAGDGVLRQFFPDPQELIFADGERFDPIGDERHSPIPFVVHRYRNRILWKVVPTCAVYCRFCFRKEHIGRKGEIPTAENIAAAHAYFCEHKEIQEVILSGGDPMTLSAKRIAQYILPLKEITHIKRIRIHTRIPVVSPTQVKADWLEVLEASGKEMVFVLHINHAGEFTKSSDIVLEKLAKKFVLLDQTVLLKGINDNAETLAALMEALLTRRIKPYYLHHLDLARGTGRFRVSLKEGTEIYRQLRGLVSGIALPTYIVEIPGGGGKVPVLELTDEQRQHLLQLGIF